MRRPIIPSQKAILLATMFLYVGPSVLFAQEYDFRKTRWGMTRQEVKESENAKFTNENPVVLSCATELLSYKTIIEYVFGAGGKLCRADFLIRIKKIPGSDYCPAYELFKKDLIDKNGLPDADDLNYRSPKDFPEPEANVVWKNNCTAKTVWEIRRTTITLTLRRGMWRSGPSDEFDLRVSYAPGIPSERDMK